MDLVIVPEGVTLIGATYQGEDAIYVRMEHSDWAGSVIVGFENHSALNEMRHMLNHLYLETQEAPSEESAPSGG